VKPKRTPTCNRHKAIWHRDGSDPAPIRHHQNLTVIRRLAIKIATKVKPKRTPNSNRHKAIPAPIRHRDGAETAPPKSNRHKAISYKNSPDDQLNSNRHKAISYTGFLPAFHRHLSGTGRIRDLAPTGAYPWPGLLNKVRTPNWASPVFGEIHQIT